LPTSGEKPGYGTYKCTDCGNVIELKKPSDTLSVCTICKNQKFKKKTKKSRSILEILIFLFWIFLIIKIFIFDFDNFIIQTYFPSLTWAIKYKFFILIGFLVLLWLGLKNKEFFILICFVIFYPFFFLFWRIPKILFKTKNWVGIFSTVGIVTSFLKSLKLNFIVFTVVMISGLLILVSNNYFFLVPSLVILFLFLIFHFVRRFSQGFNKFEIFTKYAGSILKFWQQIQDAIGTSQSKENEESNRLQWLLVLNKCCGFLVSKLRYLQKSSTTFFYYLFNLSYSIVLVIVVFAFQNLALYKIDASSFNGQPKGGILFFVYYSTNTLFTSNIVDFYPVSILARLFGTVEIIFGFFVLVILVYLLFTILREKHKQEIETSIITLEKQGSELEKIINTEFHLSIDQAINEVQKIKGSLLKVIYYLMSNII